MRGTSRGAVRLVQTIAESVKKVLANATIDELVCFEGRFPSVKTYYGGRALRATSPSSAEYANVFEIPLPPGRGPRHAPVLRLDRLLPDDVHGLPHEPAAAAAPEDPDPVRPHGHELRRRVRAPGVPRAVDPARRHRTRWREGASSARAGDVSKGNKAELVYKFKIQGSQSQRGEHGGRCRADAGHRRRHLDLLPPQSENPPPGGGGPDTEVTRIVPCAGLDRSSP